MDHTCFVLYNKNNCTQNTYFERKDLKINCLIKIVWAKLEETKETAIVEKWRIKNGWPIVVLFQKTFEREPQF